MNDICCIGHITLDKNSNTQKNDLYARRDFLLFLTRNQSLKGYKALSAGHGTSSK